MSPLHGFVFTIWIWRVLWDYFFVLPIWENRWSASETMCFEIQHLHLDMSEISAGETTKQLLHKTHRYQTKIVTVFLFLPEMSCRQKKWGMTVTSWASYHARICLCSTDQLLQFQEQRIWETHSWSRTEELQKSCCLHSPDFIGEGNNSWKQIKAKCRKPQLNCRVWYYKLFSRALYQKHKVRSLNKQTRSVCFCTVRDQRITEL